MTSRAQDFVALGALGAPHGLQGELRLKLFNPSSELLQPGRRVWLRFADGRPPRELAITACKRSGADHALLGLQGIADRDAAVALRGAQLCVARSELPELADGEHYLIDLVGLRVRLADGREIGVVEDAIEYPAAQVLRVAVEGGSIELPLLPPYLVALRPEHGEVIAAEIEDLEIVPARRGGQR